MKEPSGLRPSTPLAGGELSTALSGDKSTLESTVAAKDQALVSTQGKVEELQNAITQRSARFDALSMHASGLEAEMEIQRMDRSKLEEQVRQVATDLQGLTTTYGVDGAAEAAPAASTLKLLLPGSPGMPFVRVTPILSSALAYQGSRSSRVIGQSSRFAPSSAP